ncbi:MAG: hypothetical protein V3S16_17180 [Candidatus Desulfatibia sp.]|uniref:hypothetical protein n=1 Tax=Candidatus Desulfatibia sp. TaxID=3101189 RepID=UPI002F2C153D
MIAFFGSMLPGGGGTIETEARIMDTTEKIETRSNPGTIIDRYSSVEITVGKSEPVYMFKIRNSPFAGIAILVKEDSVILKHLKVGDKLNLKYNPAVASDLPEYLTSEIRHIIKDDNGRYNGHYLVDFAVSRN